MKYCVNIMFFGTTAWLLGSLLLFINYIDPSRQLLYIGALMFFSGLAADLFCFIAKQIVKS